MFLDWTFATESPGPLDGSQILKLRMRNFIETLLQVAILGTLREAGGRNMWDSLVLLCIQDARHPSIVALRDDPLDVWISFWNFPAPPSPLAHLRLFLRC